jgi:hypothetical protein
MNQILEQTKAAILQKADPRLVPTIKKTEAAGLKVLDAPQMQEMIKKQLGAGAEPEMIGAGIAKVAGILLAKSKGQLPPQILMPTSVLLLCDGLQALEEIGKVKVDNDFLAACTKALGSSLAQLFGATPDKLQGLVDKAKPQQPAPPPPTGIVAAAQGGA